MDIQTLSQINRDIKNVIEKIGVEKVQSEPIVWAYYLMDFFNFNVTKGGFAQLIYNLQGNYLEDIEEMLRRTNAQIAFDYYVRAIELCLNDSDSYQKFISGNYVDENSVKNKLHLISIDYFGKKIDFADESNSFIDNYSSEVIERIEVLNEN